jgi:ABC-type branched-subunit amino acid transport system substrate-binding protein
VLAGCADSGDDDAEGAIRFGVFIREGGDSADEVLAVREINAAGGITIGEQSHDLELIRVFDGASAEGGVKAVDSFVKQGAVAAIGPRWSSILLGARADHSDGAAHAAIEAGLPVVSGTATSAEISTLDDDDLIWRTIPSDDHQGQVGAHYAYEKRGARTAAILYRDDAWGRGLQATFAATFEQLGGTVQASASYDPERDLQGYDYPELADLLADKPDVFYILAFDEFPQISLRIVQGGYLEPYGDALPLFLNTDGSYDPSILTNASPEVLPHVVGTVPGPSPGNETYAKYLDAFEAAGLGPRENAWSYPYDAVYVLAYAIQAAQSTDAAELKQQLRAVSGPDGDDDVAIGLDEWAAGKKALERGEPIDYDGASGPIDFDENGDPSAGYYSIWQVTENDDGDLEFTFDESSNFEFGE